MTLIDSPLNSQHLCSWSDGLTDVDYGTPQWKGQVYPSEAKGTALTNAMERLSMAVCCPYYASGLHLYSSDMKNSDVFSSRIFVYTEGQHASCVVFPYITVGAII